MDVMEFTALDSFPEVTQELLEIKEVREAVFPDLRNTLLAFLADNPRMYDQQIPGLLSLYQRYDSTNGTSLGELLRSMYSRLAIACADYDQSVSESEQNVLFALGGALGLSSA
jgi:hypothetical protein